jgi:GT2 family glycosyltransferase/glycosyltransferase involved in cell wall biosynthesis
VFASGVAELNRAMLDSFLALRSDLPLCVVAEFEPERPAGQVTPPSTAEGADPRMSGGSSAFEWIPWHPKRTFDQNLAYVQTALAGRPIESGAVAYDRRSALGDLRKAARQLAPNVLTVWDEDMRVAPPGALPGFLLRRAVRTSFRQLNEGGRLRSWLRRIAHPSEAEIPLRARAAQARGLAAARMRGTRTERSMPLKTAALQSGVTIVIPSRDGLELLREMLPPLLGQLRTGEVIVVDNGSSDGTAEWLAREFPEVRVLAHRSPLSFAAAVNRGIGEANYARTLMLNNDMIVEAGFVAALNSAFEQVPDLFCATAQIFFPDGARREETGKTVWRRNSDLDFPVRCNDPVAGEDLTWVLYGSGGCSLFDTARLAALGGVAELYDPAYVEDLDFGFRAWKRGWPTVYCASARVEHRHRSTTSRFYTERQIDFFTERNYLRFVANAISDGSLLERLWSEGIRRLQLQAMRGRGAALDALRDIPSIGPAPPPPAFLSEPEILALTNGDVAIFPGERRSSGTTVLIASPYPPFPLSHGGAVRIFNLMRATAQTANLILVAFVDEMQRPAAELVALCSRIVLVRRHGSHYRHDTPRPDMVEEFDSATFRACLKQAVHQWKPEIVQLEFTWMAQYADACHPAKTILVEHDITFDLQQQLLENAPPSGTARLELEEQLRKWRAFETAAWSAVDCVVTMSAKDSTAIAGARLVECLPNGVDCDRFQPVVAEPEEGRLLLIGSFAHMPNLLALEFFLRDVWSRLGSGYTLHVIGGARHEYYLDYFRNRVSIGLTQPAIEIEGFVADVRRAYHRAAVVLAPLTASAGTNIKVLEAMAMGKVVVSTTAGVNGLDVTAGNDCLLAETGPQMAECIAQIGKDESRRAEIERNARQTALRFDWKAIGQRQLWLYERLRAEEDLPDA